eukprot:g8890.t1
MRRNRAAPFVLRPFASVSNFEVDTSSTLSLTNVRASLIREEDNIIFNLITRAQFARNGCIYNKHHYQISREFKNGEPMSVMEYLLVGTEQLHGSIRRYTSPDEHPFFPNELTPSVLPDIQYPSILPKSSESTDLNNLILKSYVLDVIPEITHEGDDGNHGSAALADVQCLQALSKRIHLGKFVAEVKFRSDPDTYMDLIKDEDRDGIMTLLTHSRVEDEVVKRVREKVSTQLQYHSNSEDFALTADKVANLYRNWIIPLTKDVEVEVLLNRFNDTDHS